jgi:hypothetical protein
MSKNLETIRMKGGDGPMLIYQPFNFIIFLSFYSPIILALFMVGLSFLFQNFKGFIFVGFLIGVSVLRSFIYMISGASPIENDGTLCNSIQYTKYGNSTFSAFVFAFTIVYLFIPMFTNQSINFWIFSSLIVYFFIDVFIKLYKGCVNKMTDLFLNVLAGMVSSAIIISLMYTGNSSKFLFFNETQSNKEICSMPKKQTFKCNVYKNGELIGAV